MDCCAPRKPSQVWYVSGKALLFHTVASYLHSCSLWKVMQGSSEEVAALCDSLQKSATKVGRKLQCGTVRFYHCCTVPRRLCLECQIWPAVLMAPDLNNQLKMDIRIVEMPMVKALQVILHLLLCLFSGQLGWCTDMHQGCPCRRRNEVTPSCNT